MSRKPGAIHSNGERAAREAYRKSAHDGHSYVERIGEAWYSDFKNMHNYPKLVDLAHSLE